MLAGGRIKNVAFKGYETGYQLLRPMSSTKQRSFVSVPLYTLVILRHRSMVTMPAHGAETLRVTGVAGRSLNASLSAGWRHE